MNQHPKITPEMIEHIAAQIEWMEGTPKDFANDFRTWAENWDANRSYKSPDNPALSLGIPIRPYTVVDLAKQLEGVAGRTKIHEILKSIPLHPKERKTLTGKLTPEVVRMVLEQVCQRDHADNSES